MEERKTYLLLLLVWILAAGSCILWGSAHLWVAGLSVTVISITCLVYANLPGTDKREHSQYTIGGFIMLLVGLLLLYVGIFQQ
jgi:hypothetical protein